MADTKGNSWASHLSKILRWFYISRDEVATTERQFLSKLETSYDSFLVDIGSGNELWTLKFNSNLSTNNEKAPLVFIHGLCGSSGIWAKNFDDIVNSNLSRTIYALDLLGFGQSSRPDFPNKPEHCEIMHIEALEQWRKQMKIESFVLLGHSLGSFIATNYAIIYPKRVFHLILAEPWGFPKKPEKIERIFPDQYDKSWTVRIVKMLGEYITPMAAIRAAGPFGPFLIAKTRPDLMGKFEELDCVAEYIYLTNAQKGSGERSFLTMMDKFGWAKIALSERLKNLSSDIGMSLIYGEKTWLQQLSKSELHRCRNGNGAIRQYTLPNAGHHVYADDPMNFNSLVIHELRAIDKIRNGEMTHDENLYQIIETMPNNVSH